MVQQQGSPKFSGFIRRLVDDGAISAQQMQSALDNAKKNKLKNVIYSLPFFN